MEGMNRISIYCPRVKPTDYEYLSIGNTCRSPYEERMVPYIQPSSKFPFDHAQRHISLHPPHFILGRDCQAPLSENSEPPGIVRSHWMRDSKINDVSIMLRVRKCSNHIIRKSLLTQYLFPCARPNSQAHESQD